jgi:hypothetical protein
MWLQLGPSTSRGRSRALSLHPRIANFDGRADKRQAAMGYEAHWNPMLRLAFFNSL